MSTHAKVISLSGAKRRRTTGATETTSYTLSPFGKLFDDFPRCPKCLEAGEPDAPLFWLCVYRAGWESTYTACLRHQVCWHEGVGRDDGEERDARRQDLSRIRKLKPVAPRYLPAVEARYEKERRKRRSVADLFMRLSETQQELMLSLLCELTDQEIEPDYQGVGDRGFLESIGAQPLAPWLPAVEPSLIEAFKRLQEPMRT